MALSLWVGPPGSGRTHAMLALARRGCADGRRVWWVGLPAQRAAVYRRATLPGTADAAAPGALLGLEFLTLQQVYYRLLARARELHPLIIGSGRLVLVGEALAGTVGAVPAPGEARLFAQAIAEAKRFGVEPPALGGDDDPERRRLVETFERYERLKAAEGGAWDYDDFRAAARELAERDPDACEADLLIVDGFRELGPLELRLFRALAERREVHVTLPHAPVGLELPEPDAVGTAPERSVERYRAANPVAEARWVLRSLKRDLAAGDYHPLDLAVIAPPERIPALATLADEYGVPLVDETPRSLADCVPGRILVELLELPDHPTASGLLAVPELAELADAALDAGVAGADAIAALAERLGLEAPWHAWLARLEVQDEPLAWARRLVGEVLPRLLAHAPADAAADLAVFQERALRAAQEASRLADGAGFRAWWAALLRQSAQPRELPGGVALLTATLASGRHFRRAYLLGANEGAYGADEREDYFVPEDDRAEPPDSLARLGLPLRFQGRDLAVFEELLARADELVVSYAEADQGGPLVPEPLLVGDGAPPLPAVPAGSALELPGEPSYSAELQAVDLGAARVEALRRYATCGFRYWGERRLGDPGPRPWYDELRAALRAEPRLEPPRLEALAERFPEAAGWLHAHRERLQALTYGVRLPQADDAAVHALLDAAERDGEHATLVRFTAPDAVLDAEEAEAYVKERWTELWAAGHLLERYRGRVKRVDVTVWPLLGEPLTVFERGISYRWRQIATRERRAEQAYADFARGDASPRPGFHCRTCPVVDVCREGRPT